MALRARTVPILLMIVGAGAAAAYVVSARSPIPPSPDRAGSAPAGRLFPEILDVTDAVSDGTRWYLADGRADRIHVLDNAGRYLSGFGRTGRGPGEFYGPAVLAASATRIYAAERGRPQISVFDSAGRFLVLLSVPPGCRGAVVKMVTLADDLYALRRCLELPERVWYRVERSRSGAALEVVAGVADTVVIPARGGVPMQFPLFAAGRDHLLLGDGGRLCQRVFHLPDGLPVGERCLSDVPRYPFPERERTLAARRSRGRVAAPDSLPRAITVLLTDTTLVVQVPDGLETATWLALAWSPAAARRGQPLGRPHVEQSFVSSGAQLVVWDDADGTRLEVVHGIY